MSEQKRVETADVIAWHRARFGEPDDALVGLKGAEEMGEVAGALVKRAEGAVRPEKGMLTREDWTRHLLDEVGDVGIVLHTLCAREGTTLDEVIARRFRGDVSKRVGQEKRRTEYGEAFGSGMVPTLAPDLTPRGESR